MWMCCCSIRPARSRSAIAGDGVPARPGVSEAELADAAQLASLADETPEGRSIVVLAKEKYGLRGRDMAPLNARFVPFTAQTRMSGVDLDGRRSARARSMRSGHVEGRATGPVG